MRNLIYEIKNGFLAIHIGTKVFHYFEKFRKDSNLKAYKKNNKLI